MDNVIITVAGKGGVGKTSISAAIVRQLVKEHPDKRILAIDADPAVGLATALGVTVTSTIDDIRKTIAEAGKGERDKTLALALLGEAKYRIFDAMVEQDGYSFIAVGRPESAGCYCGVNAYLKVVISSMSKEFDYVVIDGEAGIEQVNRRVMEKVTHLILISDASKKGINVIKTIKSVADELMMFKECGVIINRLGDDSQKQYIDTGDIPILAYIPNDNELQLADIKGESILKLPDNSNVVIGVKEALKAINI